MPPWLVIFGIVAGSLFALKVLYGVSVAVVLPVTGGALFVSTSRVRVNAAVEALQMDSGQLLVDLGCGDGRILRAAAKRFGCRGIGYEINPLAFLRAQIRCLFYPGVRVRFRDFTKVDLSRADVVTCYLYPDVMRSLAAKLQTELRPETRVISFNFPLPGFAPRRILRPGGALHNDPIYVYRMAPVSALQAGNHRKMSGPAAGNNHGNHNIREENHGQRRPPHQAR